MTRALLCVPNFSEGRRTEVLEGLVRVAKAVPEVALLRHEMDADHHRAVLTLAGPPPAVEEAAFALVREAARRIDLRLHQGVHPRMGAADVVPFLPLGEATMQEAVDAARRVGRRIGEELSIPVFLYEEAATRPRFRNLAEVRRGGAEGLARRLGQDPAWRPDFGPERLHPMAGACAVGARTFLLAYNVNLESQDLALARQIARAVRERDGGFPHVKALGLRLEAAGCVQVSMNLTDFRVTPVTQVYDEVVRQAAAAGVAVRASELIGLAPRAALPEDPATRLRLQGFDPSRQILEEAYPCEHP